MMAIAFLLKTLQPILATSFQGDPNSDVSYPYIPGSMIRGALIGRYLSKNGLHGDILADANVRRLFFDGTTCYLNAYLNSQTGKRTFPTLLSWRKEKGDELTEDKPLVAYDFSIGKPDDGSLENPKAVGEGFWAEEEGCVKLYSIARRINIHHSRDRSKGRATETEGEIFRYDAIDAGQTFQGVILCDSADRQILIELLEPQDIWLGGSRSAGYGHVEIIEVRTEDEKWQEIDICPEQRTHENRLKITLLSDLLLRDVLGQPVAAPPTQLIADILGIPLGEPINTYMDSTLIGGFNRKWGLPLPQVPAVRAGSVFVYEGTGITAEQICFLEEEGIGERRAEGFGRVAVNWMDKDYFDIEKPKPKLPSDRPQLQTSDGEKIAKDMAERILRRKLEYLLLDQVNSYKLEPNYLTNSQLSRLMLVARRSLDSLNSEHLTNLINELPSNALRQYEKTKVLKKSLNKQIEHWLEHPKEWLKNRVQEVGISEQKSSLTDELAQEYTFRLIMAIAKNALREGDNE